ncbi:kynureninase [Bordetella genomosp. 4]|uniref:Kynureninase n=1 Tax=Bordetella genomosp. 4 TaxID=463044 RepID=A0A261TMR2_9BORD|nr:kynureninase [Bordetella genomosp. 4]OZI43352.1 kynureninase [Bordetella genomosp. 4]OZI50889.1 kynureninase [Bordetella genomosp. 4]
MHTREACLQADQQDPLAPLKAQFDIPAGVLYMDGNSLGVLPKAAVARSAQVIQQEWGQGLIRSWNDASWFELPSRLGDKLGRLIGAGTGQVVVTDTTSLNLFKSLAAAIRIQQQAAPQRKIIVSERDNFPTDLYMIQGMIDLLQQGYEMRLVDEDLSLEQALDDSVAVLLLSHVNYRTGHMYDMADVTAQAHARGALTIWDLAHAAGAVPVDLTGANADFAVGCTYKYLNGGPGAPAFIWVAPRHTDHFWQPLSGWWGHQRPFDMAVNYEPAGGIRRYLCGTQPIVSLSLVECGLDISLQADMNEVRRKSLALTDLFIALVESRCARHPLTLVTPREHAHRGSHVSLRHPHGYAVMQALIARGVIGDYREPEVLRFGFTPLYFGYTDVWDAVEILTDVLDSEIWKQPEFSRRGAVT